MIYNAKITDNINRTYALAYLEEKKRENPNLRVLDVGGAHCCWGRDYVTHVLDIWPPENDVHEPRPKSGTIYYTGEMCNLPVWEKVFEEVEKNGKFDFLISTHTIEDVGSVSFLCEMFSRTAKEGFIAVPSKYNELDRFPGDIWRGYAHHRWVFDARENEITAYPKQAFVEFLLYIEDWSRRNPRTPENMELQFFWKDRPDIKIVNNDLLGPSNQHIFEYYTALVR